MALGFSEGLWIRVQGFGLQGSKGLGFRAQGVGSLEFKGSGFRIQGFEFSVVQKYPIHPLSGSTFGVPLLSLLA